MEMSRQDHDATTKGLEEARSMARRARRGDFVIFVAKDW